MNMKKSMAFPEAVIMKNRGAELRPAGPEEFLKVRGFYWEVIDLMKDREDTVGWKKGIYPTDGFIQKSLENGELCVLDGTEGYLASVILNSAWNEGYEGVPWGLECSREEILVPHALAVHPAFQRQGIGKTVVRNIISIAESQGKKTVRLDILGGNTAAERLYTGMGFTYVQAKEMFYEDTGWTEYVMYELVL